MSEHLDGKPWISLERSVLEIIMFIESLVVETRGMNESIWEDGVARDNKSKVEY